VPTLVQAARSRRRLAGERLEGDVIRGIGETSAWWNTVAVPSSVYLWRVQVEGMAFQSPDDALAVVAAVGRAPNSLLDVRGIALRVSEAGIGQLDVVQTSRELATNTNLLMLWPDARGVAEAVVGDPSVKGRFPQLVLRQPEWLELAGPADAIDFWRSAPVLWDRFLGSGRMGGPTAAFSNREGVYVGQADDGTMLRSWSSGGKPGLGPSQDDGSSTTTILLWVGGAALAAGAIYWFTRKNKEQRA
jgi:LPXTG-motif cell wall-anchored protein